MRDLSNLTAWAARGMSFWRAGFFAVCDGHCGAEAAEHLSRNLHTYLLSSPDLATHPAEALEAAVEAGEAALLQELSASDSRSGSTLLALLLVDDVAYIANVGDCRAVLARGDMAKQVGALH